MLSIGKRAAGVGAVVAAAATLGIASTAGATTIPHLSANQPAAYTPSGPVAGAFQTGAAAAIFGWNAGADAAAYGWNAGAAAMGLPFGFAATAVGPFGIHVAGPAIR
jgi:hypothetical protein